MPRPRSADRTTCFNISPDTRIGSPSLITVSSPSMASRSLPVEGLCAWQQKAENDRFRRRVSATFPAAYAAARLRPHPLLRIPRRTEPRCPAATGPATVAATYARKRFAAVTSGTRVVPVPYLLHTDDRRRTALTSHGPPHRAWGGAQRLFLNPTGR